MSQQKCTAGKENDGSVEVYSWEGECCLCRSGQLHWAGKENDVSEEKYSQEEDRCLSMSYSRDGDVIQGFLCSSLLLEKRGMSYISVQQRPRRAPVYKCTPGRKSAAGKEGDDWIIVYRREGKRCRTQSGRGCHSPSVQQGRKRMSVQESTAGKERDVCTEVYCMAGKRGMSEVYCICVLQRRKQMFCIEE